MISCKQYCNIIFLINVQDCSGNALIAFTSSFSSKSKCEDNKEWIKEKKLFTLICKGSPYFKANLTDLFVFKSNIDQEDSTMISPGEKVIVKRIISSNENLFKAKNRMNATSSFSTSFGCYFLCTYVQYCITTCLFFNLLYISFHEFL